MADDDKGTPLPTEIEEDTVEDATKPEGQTLLVGPDGDVHIAPSAMEEDKDAPKEAFEDTPLGKVVHEVSEKISTVSETVSAIAADVSDRVGQAVKNMSDELIGGHTPEETEGSIEKASADKEGSSGIGNYEEPGVTGVSDFDPIGPGLADVMKEEGKKKDDGEEEGIKE